MPLQFTFINNPNAIAWRSAYPSPASYIPIISRSVLAPDTGMQQYPRVCSIYPQDRRRPLYRSANPPFLTRAPFPTGTVPHARRLCAIHQQPRPRVRLTNPSRPVPTKHTVHIRGCRRLLSALRASGESARGAPRSVRPAVAPTAEQRCPAWLAKTDVREADPAVCQTVQ